MFDSKMGLVIGDRCVIMNSKDGRELQILGVALDPADLPVRQCIQELMDAWSKKGRVPVTVALSPTFAVSCLVLTRIAQAICDHYRQHHSTPSSVKLVTDDGRDANVLPHMFTHVSAPCVFALVWNGNEVSIKIPAIPDWTPATLYIIGDVTIKKIYPNQVPDDNIVIDDSVRTGT